MDSGLRSSCKAVSDVIAVRAHCALVNTDLHNFEHHLSQPVGGICEKSQEAKKTFFLPYSQLHTGYYTAFNLTAINDLKLSKVFIYLT